MAGLFSSSEQDLLGNIMTQRQQANQALGSGYGKYGGIVQAAGGLIDTGTDAMFGGKVGAADPRMQQMSKVKDIFAKVTKELGDVKSPAFYERIDQELQAAGFPEQAQKASDRAAELTATKLKNEETQLSIQDKKLSNYFNRATLLPRVKSTFVKLQADQQAVAKAEQDYEQAQLLNPLAAKEAAQRLANAKLTFQKTTAELEQFKKLSPSVVQQAQANATSAQMGVRQEASVIAAQQIMSEFRKGTPEYNAALDNLLAIKSPSSLAPTQITFGTDREAYSSAMYDGKQFKDLTPTEQADVNLKLKEKSVTVARAGAYEIGKDLKAFDDAIKDNTVSFQAAQTAKTLLQEAKASNNPDAWEAARTTVARAVGKSKLSNEDIKRLGGSPEIVQAIRDITSKAFTGTPTLDTQRKLYATAAIIERFEAEQINKQADRFTAAAAEAGFSKDPGVYFPKVEAGGSVSWKDL